MLCIHIHILGILGQSGTELRVRGQNSTTFSCRSVAIMFGCKAVMSCWLCLRVFCVKSVSCKDVIRHLFTAEIHQLVYTDQNSFLMTYRRRSRLDHCRYAPTIFHAHLHSSYQGSMACLVMNTRMFRMSYWDRSSRGGPHLTREVNNNN
jgi:hypothetical protein